MNSPFFTTKPVINGKLDTIEKIENNNYNSSVMMENSPCDKNEKVLLDLSHLVGESGSNSGTPNHSAPYRKLGPKKSSFNKQVSATKPADNPIFNFHVDQNN